MEPVGALTPFLPPTLPLFLFGVFGVRECNTQVHAPPWCVPGRLLVAGNTCPRPWYTPLPFLLFLFPLSLFLSLSLSLSLFLSLFFLFPFFPFLLVWVSLDAFVIAGNPSLLLLVCPWTRVS